MMIFTQLYIFAFIGFTSQYVQINLWIIGVQTTLLVALLGGIWAILIGMKKKVEKLDEKCGKIDTRVAVTESKVTDISNNVYHMIRTQSQTRHKETELK